MATKGKNDDSIFWVLASESHPRRLARCSAAPAAPSATRVVRWCLYSIAFGRQAHALRLLLTGFGGLSAAAKLSSKVDN